MAVIAIQYSLFYIFVVSNLLRMGCRRRQLAHHSRERRWRHWCVFVSRPSAFIVIVILLNLLTNSFYIQAFECLRWSLGSLVSLRFVIIHLFLMLVEHSLYVILVRLKNVLPLVKTDFACLSLLQGLDDPLSSEVAHEELEWNVLVHIVSQSSQSSLATF